MFLIHPDVLSVNIEEIESFASVWNAYYFNNVDNFTNNTDFLFVIGNKNSIFTGYTPPTKEEIKENKLNLNMNMPIKSLVYEKI